MTRARRNAPPADVSVTKTMRRGRVRRLPLRQVSTIDAYNEEATRQFPCGRCSSPVVLRSGYCAVPRTPAGEALCLRCAEEAAPGAGQLTRALNQVADAVRCARTPEDGAEMLMLALRHVGEFLAPSLYPHAASGGQ